jgi:hypothetical protein
MQQRLQHWVIKNSATVLPLRPLPAADKRQGVPVSEMGQNRKIVLPNCNLMNHRIRLDDIVASVEHPEGKLGGLPK